MWLWHTGFEAGPNRKLQATGGDPGQYGAKDFAGQDLWASISSSSYSSVIDADAGGSPHCGRYAMAPPPAGFGDPGKFSGYTYSRSGTTIWWSQRVKIVSFSDNTKLATNQNYVLGRFNFNDGSSDTANNYLGLGLTIGPTPPQFAFCVLDFASNNTGGNSIIAETSYRSPATGWLWLQVEYNTSTKDVKFYIDDTQIGLTYNIGTTYNDKPAIRYACSLVTGKGSDAGMNAQFCCMGSNDSNGTIANARPPSTIKVALRQPNGNQTHQWSGAGFYDVADEAANCPNYSGTIIASNIGDVDLYTMKDSGVTGTIESVRIIFDEKYPGAGNPTHTIRSRVSGGTFQDYTNPPQPVLAGPSRFYAGREFNQTTEASPQNWSNSLFDTFESGLKAIDTTNDVGEYYASVIGPNIARAGYDPCSGGNIKTYLGGSFTINSIKYWNGSSWVVKPLKRWNGSSWVATSY